MTAKAQAGRHVLVPWVQRHLWHRVLPVDHPLKVCHVLAKPFHEPRIANTRTAERATQDPNHSTSELLPINGSSQSGHRAAKAVTAKNERIELPIQPRKVTRQTSSLDLFVLQEEPLVRLDASLVQLLQRSVQVVLCILRALGAAAGDIYKLLFGEVEQICLGVVLVERWPVEGRIVVLDGRYADQRGLIVIQL